MAHDYGCSNCGISYEQALAYFENYIANALLCGKLQGGLNACGSETILPQGTAIVTCSQLQDEVNTLLDAGKLNIPGIKSLDLDGENLVLVDQSNTTFTVDLSSLLAKTVKSFSLGTDDVLTLTLRDGTTATADLGTLIAEKIKAARWSSATITADGQLQFTAPDGTILSTDLGKYVTEQVGKGTVTGATVGADGKLTLTLGDGSSVSADLSAYVKEQAGKTGIAGAALDPDGNLVITKGDGTQITVDMDGLKHIYVARDSALTGDGSKENPLDIDFTRVCWEIFKSVTFTDDGLVIQTNNQCEPVVVPLSQFIAVLNNKITICVSDQGIITGSGKTGDCLDIDLEKLASLLTTDTNAWQTIINAINNSLSITHDSTLKGSGKTSEPLGVQLSSVTGNQLQIRDDGLYYGTTAPADISALYVSGAEGSDNNLGGRNAPLETLQHAIDIIAARNMGGKYTIFLQAGETFIIPRSTYLGTGPYTITLCYYNDPLFGDLRSNSGWWPSADARLQRPTVVVDTYKSGNLVEAASFNADIMTALTFEGVNLTVRNSAGPTTGGGWFFYWNRLDFQGGDLSIEGDTTGIGTAANILLRQCNYSRSGKSQVFIGDYAPQLFYQVLINEGVTVKDPAGKGPDVVGRKTNLYTDMKVSEVMALASYNSDTKTFFGWNANWDIFANG